jgi:hypothetical protein
MFTDAYVETNYSEMENDEVKPVNAKLDDKINVDKMNFADADAEKHDMIDVDEMRTEQMYGGMDFN